MEMEEYIETFYFIYSESKNIRMVLEIVKVLTFLSLKSLKKITFS